MEDEAFEGCGLATAVVGEVDGVVELQVRHGGRGGEYYYLLLFLAKTTVTFLSSVFIVSQIRFYIITS